MRVRRTELSTTHKFLGSFRSTKGARHTSLGQRPRSACPPPTRAEGPAHAVQGAHRMNRAFSPLHLWHQQPGPLAQAGMSTGLWP